MGGRTLILERSAPSGCGLVLGEDDPVHLSAGPGTVMVRAAVTIIDMEHLLPGHAPRVPQGISIGRIVSPEAGRTQGSTAVGVGPAAEVAPFDRQGVRALEGHTGTAVHFALSAFVSPLVEALAAVGVGPGERVLISGRGLSARLAAAIVARLGGIPPDRLDADMADRPAVMGEAFDVLVDSTADPAYWERALPRVRAGGRVLLVVPPWSVRVPFDCYPHVHRRSLTMLVRRVPSVSTSPLPGRFHQELAAQAAEEFLTEVDGMNVSSALPSVEASARAGKGLLIRWEGLVQ